MLTSICPEAWRIVVATTKAVLIATVADKPVAATATTVAGLTQRMLRDVTGLTAEQQQWLVKSLASGKTQAEIMQWSVLLVKQYSALRVISSEAWQIVVVTTKARFVTAQDSDPVTAAVTTVTDVFTEGSPSLQHQPDC